MFRILAHGSQTAALSYLQDENHTVAVMATLYLQSWCTESAVRKSFRALFTPSLVKIRRGGKPGRAGLLKDTGSLEIAKT